MEEMTLPRIEAPIGIDHDDDDLVLFAEKSLNEIRDHISENRNDAAVFTDVEQTLDEVLSNENSQSLDVRARRLENPKVILWLKDCPVWANDGWTDTIYPKGMNSYNNEVTVRFEVRPF